MIQVSLWELCLGMGSLLGAVGAARPAEADGLLAAGGSGFPVGGSGVSLSRSQGDQILDPVTGFLDLLPRREGSLQLAWIDGRRTARAITVQASAEIR